MPSGIESLRAISCDVGSCGTLKNGTLKNGHEAKYSSLPRSAGRSGNDGSSSEKNSYNSNISNSSVSSSISKSGRNTGNGLALEGEARDAVNVRRSQEGDSHDDTQRVTSSSSSSSSSYGQEMKGDIAGW